jgi:hypothetical protein
MRDFGIDGAGNVIRPGDTVIYRQEQIGFTRSTGIVQGIIDDYHVRIVDKGVDIRVYLFNTCRAEDLERDARDEPLWVS